VVSREPPPLFIIQIEDDVLSASAKQILRVYEGRLVMISPLALMTLIENPLLPSRQ
jgi:hypothetical protein